MVAGWCSRPGRGPGSGAESKLLADLEGGRCWSGRWPPQCAVAALARVVVVLGSRAEQVMARVDFGRAEPVVCDDWETGQSASLRCGLEALAGVKGLTG